MEQAGGAPGDEAGVFQPAMAPGDLNRGQQRLPASSFGVSRESEEARASQATGVAQVRRQGPAQLAGGGAHILSSLCGLVEGSLKLFQVIQTQVDRVPGSPTSLGR